MDRIQRVADMEKAYDASAAAIHALADAVAQYERIQGDYKKLSDYYGSTRWMKDFEADEKGQLPPDLKRGVLSEDGVYHLMEENRELTVRLLKIAARMVEIG